MVSCTIFTSLHLEFYKKQEKKHNKKLLIGGQTHFQCSMVNKQADSVSLVKQNFPYEPGIK